MMQFAEIGDDVYFWFAANTTAGTAGDGATPLFDVRLAGAAANAAPTASGTPTLLTHADYPDGIHEIKVDTDAFAAGEYAVFCSLTISTVNPAGFCGSFKLRTAGTAALNVNASHVGGTAQTGRDLGASVLLSSGTGAGQLDFTSGVVKANLAQYMGTAFGGTAAQIVAAFQKLFDVASPQLTAASKDQTGDSFDKVNDATIGLANLKALIDAMQADIGDASASTLGSLYAILGNAAAAIAGRLPAALESGNMPVHVKAQDNIDFGALQKASITAAVPAASAIGTDAASKVLVTPAQKLVTDANGYVTYSNAAPPSADDVRAAMEADGSKLDHLWEMTEDDGGTRRLTANALEEAPSGTGLDAAGVRAAIGMADADLDTQLAALPTAAENADAVWDEALSGHAGAGTAGAGLSAAGSAGDPWSTLLPGAYGAGTAGYLIGNLAPAGGSVWTYTVTLPDGTTPVADVIVRVCTDIAGTNVIRSSVTNSSGIATFYLQPGTYYIFCEKDGYNFSTYDTEVVS